MLFITEEDELDLSSSKNVLYFYGSWMPYHKKMLVMIGKMEEKYESIKFFAIDVDEFKSVCKRFSIDSVPSVLVINGRKTKRINGVVMMSAFKSAFADICSN